MINLFNNLDLNAVGVINTYLNITGDSSTHTIFIYCQQLYNGVGIINKSSGIDKSILISAIINIYITNHQYLFI